jgi:hypothetical protein
VGKDVQDSMSAVLLMGSLATAGVGCCSLARDSREVTWNNDGGMCTQSASCIPKGSNVCGKECAGFQKLDSNRKGRMTVGDAVKPM